MNKDNEEYYLIGSDDSDDIKLELKSSSGTFKRNSSFQIDVKYVEG